MKSGSERGAPLGVPASRSQADAARRHPRYAQYLERFRSIFRLPPGVPMHFVPGNQDVGLGPHWSFSPYSKERYATR